ncbi:hypothetical protein PAMP_006707 [Pampus punctatissimus]
MTSLRCIMGILLAVSVPADFQVVKNQPVLGGFKRQRVCCSGCALCGSGALDLLLLPLFISPLKDAQFFPRSGILLLQLSVLLLLLSTFLHWPDRSLRCPGPQKGRRSMSEALVLHMEMSCLLLILLDSSL